MTELEGRIDELLAPLGRISPAQRRNGRSLRRREKLFASMHRNAAAAADFLSLPTNRVVELGSKVEI